MKPLKSCAKPAAAAPGVPQGESSTDCSVQILSKFATSSSHVTAGLNLDSISRFSSFAQLMVLKKGCFLIVTAPSGPEPRRLLTSRLRRPLIRLCASVDRNSASGDEAQTQGHKYTQCGHVCSQNLLQRSEVYLGVGCLAMQLYLKGACRACTGHVQTSIGMAAAAA